MAEKAVGPSFFSGNIANIIPGSPLKKMIPLMEDHRGGGGGCMGTPLAYGLSANPQHMRTRGPPVVADAAAVWTVHRPTAVPSAGQADVASRIATPLFLVIPQTQH